MANFRIGEDKFRKKLRFALASDLSMEEIMKARARRSGADAERDLRNSVAALQEIFPEGGRSDAEATSKKVTTAVLDKLAEQHPDDDTIVGYATEGPERKRPTS